MQIIKRVYGEATATLSLLVMALVVVRAIVESQPWWLAVAVVGIVASIVAGAFAVLVAVFGLAIILGYNYWYSVQHVSARPVRVDEPLPLFPLTTVDGDVLDSRVLDQHGIRAR
ncbi:MAG: hypothetical protein ACOH1M_08450 [Rhodoglobus sp.]